MTITVDAIFDGQVLRPQSPLPLVLNQHYSVTIEDLPTVASPKGDAWTVLRELAGTYEGPSDWSTEHDHYIYGAPKRDEGRVRSTRGLYSRTEAINGNLQLVFEAEKGYAGGR